MPRKNLLLTTALFLALAPQVVHAATNEKQDAGTAQGEAQTSESGGLGDIVVTAQRRSENLQNVPVSITALGRDTIENVGLDSAADLAALVPSLQVQGVLGKFQPIFAIRGISQASYTANQVGPIGVYADEAYIGEAFLHGANLFDLERVEVLKGPQGTIYGKNTTGGAINLVSRTPRIDDNISGNLTAGYGNYKAVRLDGGIEGTLVPGKLAVRVAAYFEDDEGYQRIVNLGQRAAETHSWGIRGTLVFEPSDNFQSILRYTHSETDQTPAMNRPIGAIPVGPGGVGVDLSGYSRPATLGRRDFESDNDGQYLRVSFDKLTLTNTLGLDSFDIVSVSSYHRSKKRLFVDIDGGAGALADHDFDNDTKAFSQDLRLVTTGSGDVKFIGGLYYGYEKNAQRNTAWLYRSRLLGLEGLLPLLGTTDPATIAYISNFYSQYGMIEARQTLNHKSYAAYTETRWQATPRFAVIAGLRYTRDRDGQIFYNISRYASRGGAPIGSYIPGNITAGTANPIDAAFDAGLTTYLDGPYTTASAPQLFVTNKRVTGKLTLEYEASDDVMLYGTYSRGYRSGNFNAGIHYLFRQPNDTAYARPETIDAYEIGMKSDLLDRRLRLNLAAFQYDYKNQQFEDVQGIATVLLNAGASRLRGIEMEATVAPVDRLTIALNATYLDAKYKKIVLSGNDLSGNRLISAPKYSGSVAVDYAVPVGGAMELRFHADSSFRSRQWFSAYNDKAGYDRIGQKAYALVNGRLALTSDAGWEVALWGKNLFDKNFVTYGINIQSAYGMDYLIDGAPRTYGVELSYKF